jgi:hypothetical protein
MFEDQLPNARHVLLVRRLQLVTLFVMARFIDSATRPAQ